MQRSRRAAFDPTRRRLLLAGAGGLALTACGGGGGTAAPATTTTRAPRTLSLIRVFAPEQPAGVPLRLPLAFAGAEGVPTGDVPDRIEVRAVPPSGASLDPVVVQRHGEGIPSPYYPYTSTLDEPGAWQLVIAVEGAETTTDLTVRPRSELAAVPGPGEALPSIPTPTTGDALGVDPLCTATPRCPLHDVSLDQALALGKPVVLLVSTPAFCQTAICGPVLDLLVDRSATLADRATVIHAEVYTDDTASETTSTVSALGLRYEPSLFVAAADGTVRHRLDYTFDAVELDDALAATAS